MEQAVIQSIFSQIEKEVQRAENQHPDWPEDMYFRLAILSEEYGEVCKAVLQHGYEGQPLDEVRKELVQTAAMCIRFLASLEKT